MVPGALGTLPLHVQWWDPSHFDTVAENVDRWIWGIRVLVFGFFLRVGAWAALASLAWSPGARALVFAGAMISLLGNLVSSLGAGYNMDTGVWGSWAITQAQYAGEEGRAFLLATLRPVNAWGECCGRMGSVFASLGGCFLALGLLRDSFLPRWAASLPLGIGAAGMAIGMFWANSIGLNLGVGVAQSLWCLLAGALVLAGRALPRAVGA